MKNKYRILSHRYLNKAKKLIKSGEYLQASEKLWGAAAQIVKAYAVENNLNHDGHSKLFRIVENLVKKTNDEEISRIFQIANSLHINFYENWLTKEQVTRSAKDVEKFVQKIEELLK